MKLFQLLLRFDYELLQGTIDREILKVTNDTRMVQPQDVFVCIKGFYHDSHQLVTEAIRAGAAAVVMENVSCYESLELFEDITVILVESTQYALAIMASRCTLDRCAYTKQSLWIPTAVGRRPYLKYQIRTDRGAFQQSCCA